MGVLMGYRRFVTTLTLCTVASVLVGCGGGGDVGGAASANGPGGTADKDLFSVWHLREGLEGAEVPLDLSGAAFGETRTLTFTYLEYGSCTCDITIQGDQTTGTYTINSCVYEPGSLALEFDPVCNGLNDMNVYEKSANTLTLNTSRSEPLVFE